MAARKPKVEPVDEPQVQEKAVSGDAGAAALQALADQSLEQGYFGITQDPNPNSAYSLASGPDSPSAASANPAWVTAEANKKEARRG